MTVAGTEMALAGGCRHVYYLVRKGGPMAIVEAARLFYIAQPFALMGVVMGRVSVGLLLLRILGQSKVRRIVIWSCIGSTFVFGVLNSILLFVACRPSDANWNPFIKGAVCWDPTIVTKVTIAFSAWNVFIDFVLALLPASIFWHLKLSLDKRVGLILLLSGGVFAGICGAVKAAYLPSANSDDVTWATYDLLLWHGAEDFLVIVLGSVPTLKPIYDLARGRVLRGSSAGRSSGYAYPRGTPKESWGTSGTESTALRSQTSGRPPISSPVALSQKALPPPPAAVLPRPSGISVSHRVDVETWDDGRGWIMRDLERPERGQPYAGWGRESSSVDISGPPRRTEEV